MFKRASGRGGFTVFQLIIAFVLIAVLLFAMIAALKAVYRNANRGAVLGSAVYLHKQILQAAGDVPFDQAVESASGAELTVCGQTFPIAELFGAGSSISLDETTYAVPTLVIRTSVFLTVYITASGAAFDPPPKR